MRCATEGAWVVVLSPAETPLLFQLSALALETVDKRSCKPCALGFSNAYS